MKNMVLLVFFFLIIVISCKFSLVHGSETSNNYWKFTTSLDKENETSNINYRDNHIPPQTNTEYQTDIISVIPRPEWYEFCPLEFENPKHYTIPLTNPHFDNNYWYKRKKEFEKYLNECDKKEGQYRFICYDKLRSREISLSLKWVPMRQKCINFNNNWQRTRERAELIDAIKNKNIYHSGTVNVNSNIRGNFTHYIYNY